MSPSVLAPETAARSQAAGPDGLTEQERRLLRIIREAKDPAALLLFAVETALAITGGGEGAKL